MHNLEHGYTIIWYDARLPGSKQKEIRSLAERLRNNAAYQEFIATPFEPEYGAESRPASRSRFPHWSAPSEEHGSKLRAAASSAGS